MRGIDCDTWSAYFTDGQDDHLQNTLYTWYFANVCFDLIFNNCPKINIYLCNVQCHCFLRKKIKLYARVRILSSALTRVDKEMVRFMNLIVSMTSLCAPVFHPCPFFPGDGVGHVWTLLERKGL